MFELLRDHAKKNVWCNPRQDLQVILKPQRITSAHGVHVEFQHLWNDLPTPTNRSDYHIYQIGQIHPTLLGLLPRTNQWVNVAEMMHLENLVVDIYLQDGRQMPRHDSYFLVTRNRNVLLAVKEQAKISNLRYDPIYLRLYSNAYFSSDRADAEVDQIVAQGIKHVDANSTLTFQREYLRHQDMEGHAWLWHNGYMVDNINPTKMEVGDVLEFMYDSTVKAVKTFPIVNLETFDSDRDLLGKYLLSYPGDQVGDVGVDYRDDIDTYLTCTVPLVEQGSTFKGIYFHKNLDNSFRQVTHRDYSISIPGIVDLMNEHPLFEGLIDNITIQIFIRKSGYQRPLAFEANRIQELYKLPYQDRCNAMLGIDSNVSVWRAPALENSGYCRLMDAVEEQISNELVQNALGYHAITRIVADSPTFITVENGRPQSDLDWDLQRDSTVFEYDVNGHLLGFYYHTLGAEYTPRNAACKLIEGIPGKGSAKVDGVNDYQQKEIDPTKNYRFYIAPIVEDEIDHSSWTDVTGDITKYDIVNDTVIWLTDDVEHAVFFRSDKDFLSYTLNLMPINGLLRFSINAITNWPDGDHNGVMRVPFGDLELWLNGKALVENLDYFVQWPQVVVTNKEYLSSTESQQLTIRARGFCNQDMSRSVDEDVNFVKYGLMSRNALYNLRDDKVIRIHVRGKTYHRSALIFQENDVGLTMANIINGSPYSLECPMIPLRGLIGTTSQEFYDDAIEIDNEIQAYLTMKLPEPAKPPFDQILEKYNVFSPFASAVCHDLFVGQLDISDFHGQYSDQDVFDYLTNYTYLLDYDPTQASSIDLGYVSIHPHNLNTEIQLDVYQYNFLSRAIHVFLDDKVDITRFVTITSS